MALPIKPSAVTRWADTPSNVVEPSEPKKDLGFIQEKPAHEHHNWLWHNLALWERYQEDLTDIITTIVTFDDVNNRIGLGLASPLADIHVQTAVAGGGFTPSVDADELILENSGNVGLTLATQGIASINFGKDINNDIGRITYDMATDKMSFFTNDVEKMFLDTTGNLDVDGYFYTNGVPLGQESYDYYKEAAGSVANIYVLEPNSAFPAITAYTDGLRIRFKVVNTNTGASTFNINALGAKAIEYGGSALNAGMLTIGNEAIIRYDLGSDKFILEYVLNSADLFVDPATGNVGVGTTSPNRRLTIDSSDAQSLIDSTNITWSANQLTAFGNKASEYASTESSTLADGGRVVSGYTKEASATASGIRLNAYTENEPTTIGAHKLDTFKHNGAGGLTTIANGSRLFSVHNNGVEKARIMGNGDLVISGGLSASGTSNFSNSIKAYVSFNGAGAVPTIYRSYNISSITKNGTGDYWIFFSNSIGTTRYTVMGMGVGGGRILGILTQNISTFRLQIQNDGGSNDNSDPVTFAVV
jgi:hypothetical protein